RIEDRGSRIEDRRLRIEDRGSRIEDRRLRIEDRGSKIASSHARRFSILYSLSSILYPLSSVLTSPCRSTNLTPLSPHDSFRQSQSFFAPNLSRGNFPNEQVKSQPRPFAKPRAEQASAPERRERRHEHRHECRKKEIPDAGTRRGRRAGSRRDRWVESGLV